MSLRTEHRFTDDADAYVDRIIGPEAVTATSPDLTFEATVAVKDGAYTVTATWQGDVGPTRTLRIPVAGLAEGLHRLYLSVPGGNDLDLGAVQMIARR